VDHRRRRGKWEFLVRWKGYADHESTWLPVENLTYCPDLLRDYLRGHPDCDQPLPVRM
jgi:hypothetical protein